MAVPNKAQELLARISKQKEDVSALQALWASLFPEFPAVESRQCQVWLKLYDFDMAVEGLETANLKLSMRLDTAAPMDREQAIRYSSGVMKSLKLKAGAQ